MLRRGVRSALGLARGGMADTSILPAFLCPTLIHVDVDRIRRRKRTISRLQHSVASTSKLPTSLSGEIQLLLQEDEEDDAWNMDVKEPLGFSSLVMDDLGDVKGLQSKRKLRASKVLDELTLTQEVVEDMLTRGQEYTSVGESIMLLKEGMHLISANRLQNDESVQALVQAIAPKLAFVYLKYRRPTNSVETARHITGTWTAEREQEYSDTWKPVVSLAYSMGLYKEAYQLSHMLTKYSRFSGSWMTLARLQSLLRLAEMGTSNPLIEDVDTLWKPYETRGLAVPEAAMLLILDSQARRGERDKMVQTMQAMRRHGVRITSDVWKALFGYSLRGKRRKEELKLVLGTLCREDAMSLIEELIDHCVAESDLRGCLRVLRQFGIPSGAQHSDSPLLLPTFGSYSRVIELLSTVGRPLHAVRFLNKCIQYNCEGNYARLFLELNIALNDADRSEEAVYIGVSLINLPMRHQYPVPPSIQQPLGNTEAMTNPSTFFYAALLNSISNLENINAIVPATRALIKEMFTRGWEVDRLIRKALTNIIVRLGRHGRVRDLVAYKIALFAPPATESSQSEAKDWLRFLSVLNREAVADQLELVVWKKTKLEREKQYQGWEGIRKAANRTAYSIPFDELGRTRTANPVEEVGASSRPAKRGRDSSEASIKLPLTDAIEAVKEASSGAASEVAKRAPTEQANELIHRIPFEELELDVDLTPAAYALRLRVFAVVRLDFDNALRIYESMIVNGVMPSIHHIEPLIEGLVLAGRVADANKIKHRAKKEFYLSEFPLNIYASLVRGFGQKEDWQSILSIATEIRARNVNINRFMQIAFRKARIMVRQKAKIAGMKGDGLAQDQYSKIAEQPMPKRQDVQPPMSVYEATMMFNDYHLTGQWEIAQQQLAKALDEGLRPDAHLRDVLAKCDNWLRKQMEPMAGVESKDGQRRRIEECLRLCRINRERMKVSRREELAHVRMQIQDERQRSAMLDLLREAVGSRRLWNEAQRMRDNSVTLS